MERIRRLHAEMAVRMAAPEVLERGVKEYLYRMIREWDF
jgi:hypothetical protein